jgi:NTP pyrophosphatase (non-canonical NTP hydrolase)
MEFKEIIKETKKIKRKYERLAINNNEDPWNAKDYIRGFVGDVGDLSKYISLKYSKRKIKDIDNKIKHELADCMWSIIAIADEVGINLEREYKINLEYIDQRLKENTNE